MQIKNQIKSSFYLTFLGSVLLSVISLFGCATQAATSENESSYEKVAFAGITFQGRGNLIASHYPYSNFITTERNSTRELAIQLKNMKPNNFDVSLRKLDKDSGHKYAVSLMIDREYVSQEKIQVKGKPFNKLSVYLSAQFVMFDVENMQYLAGFPLLPVSYTDIYKNKPTNEDIKQAIVHALYNDSVKTPGIIPQFLKNIQSAPAPGAANLAQFSIREVTIGEKAHKDLPEYLIRDKERLKHIIAQQYLKELASHQRVATQPYLVDASVIKLQKRFSGSDTGFVLELPKPAYVVDFTLRGFKEKVHDKNSSGEARNYATYANVKVSRTAGEETLLFDENMVFLISDIIPASQKLVDHWEKRRESLLVLIEQIIRAIPNKKSKFYKAQKFNKSALAEIKRLKEAYRISRQTF